MMNVSRPFVTTKMKLMSCLFFRNAMNYAGDDMDFSSDAMENIDFSGIDVDHILGIPLPDAYMNPASGPPAQNQQNPPGNF